MATPESIAIRRADALTRVEAALGRIATQTGVEIAPYPEPHKRPEVRPAIEAEWLADALEAVSEKTERLSDANAIEAELATVAAERDAAIEAATAVKEADEQDQAMRDAMQRLVGLVATDDLVRFALAKVGFVQAKQDEGGEDWSVSVVGLGPDLFAEPFEPSAADAPSEPETTDEPKRTRAKKGSA